MAFVSCSFQHDYRWLNISEQCSQVKEPMNTTEVKHYLVQKYTWGAHVHTLETRCLGNVVRWSQLEASKQI